MKTKTKVLILLAAVALTFLEFNFILCSGNFCELLNSGREWTLLASAGHAGQPDVVVTAKL